MTATRVHQLTLSIYPFTRGVGFVFFEGPESPFEWGVKEIKGKQKNEKSLKVIEKLIADYRPEVMVIEDASEPGSRRTPRIRRLYRMLVHLAEAEYVELRSYSRMQVLSAFAASGASQKREIARVIASRIPGFAHKLPRIRRTWMNEDPRQALFDAAALGLTHFAWDQTSPYADQI